MAQPNNNRDMYFKDLIRQLAERIYGNNRKTVCRMYLDSPTSNRLTFLYNSRAEHHNKVQSVDDIYNFGAELI